MSGTHERGATIVEFAVVAPLLFLLLFGVIEFGRAVATYTAVTTAAREAARYGTTVGEEGDPVRPYEDCDAIRDAAFAKTPLLNPSETSVAITYDGGGLCPQGGTATQAVAPGDRIQVEVETIFRSPIPLISNIVGDLEVAAVQRRTIYPGP